MNNIQFIHRRKFKHLFDFEPASRGGSTIAYQEVKPGLIKYSTARCSSLDNFSKKIGRDVATGRLTSGKVETITGVSVDEFRELMYNRPV